MAEKILYGDSLVVEVRNKFNKLVDETNEMADKINSFSAGYILPLSGDGGTLTDEQYAKSGRADTFIEWHSSSGLVRHYRPWYEYSPKRYFSCISIYNNECTRYTIEIDQINHSWSTTSTTYEGGGVTENRVNELIETAINGALEGSY